MLTWKCTTVAYTFTNTYVCTVGLIVWSTSTCTVSALHTCTYVPWHAQLWLISIVEVIEEFNKQPKVSAMLWHLHYDIENALFSSQLQTLI